MLRVIEYFARSLKVIRNDTQVERVQIPSGPIPLKYVSRTLSEIVSKNGMTLKPGERVVQGH